MENLLIVLAVLAGIIGGLLLSQATTGVGIIGGACLLGILARIVQAERQHRQVIADLVDLQTMMPGPRRPD